MHPWPTGEDILDPQVPPTRIWIPGSPLIVLGYSQDPEREVDLEAAARDNVPVYKRRGGGGAVYLDPGCVCIALRFERRKDLGIHDFFRMGNAFVADALEGAFGLRASVRGISDLAVETPEGLRKVSGSSLHLPRECAVFLASVLVATPTERIDRYLRHPSREPDYRGGRTHGEFVTNLSTLPETGGLTPFVLRDLLTRTAQKKAPGSPEA